MEETNLSSELNKLLSHYLNWPLKITSGVAVDLDGSKTDEFGTLIYAAQNQNEELIETNADNLACIIDSYRTINLDSFSTAYNRIAKAKGLTKSKLPLTDTATRNETLGIILAINSQLPLDIFSDELQRLNQKTHSSQWPDVIAILTQGTINYAMQFPGNEKLNPFLLPSKEIVSTSAPAFYVLPVMTPTNKYTFNMICSFIFTHLAIFSPGIKLPSLNEVLGATPRSGVTLAGYQFNLSGELLPVPSQFYKSRYLPKVPHVFKDTNHPDISFCLEYLPWQDGGVILLRGKIPLQGLLVYLGNKSQNRKSIVRLDDLQISSILPITEVDYLEMIQKIQHQTSFKLSKNKEKNNQTKLFT